MKKTFQLTHPKIKYARLIEGVKNDVRKYIKRERRKTLPKGADFWDFDCRFGETEAEAKGIHLAEMDGCINDAEARELQSFYIEILAKPGFRSKKAKAGETSAPRTAPATLPEIKSFGKQDYQDAE